MITKRDASIATFLRSVPVFLDLKGSSLEILFEFLEERRWDVGEHICNEGEMGRTLYVIREGEVEVLRRSATGNNQSIVKLGPGECFGEMALVELQPRSATCVVRKKAVTYSLTNPELWNVYKSDNFAYVIILQNICRMLSRRLRKADSRIVEFVEAIESGKAASAKKKPKPVPKKKKK
ncbi:MAG: cyclic nucleotide-binding domain-containing protein [Archangium sp.]|nr:cyclic nucleotide-binding domain-containing protein [Archangium sp.]